MLSQWDINGASTLLQCPLCELQLDSHEHLSFECLFSSQVWSSVKGKASLQQVLASWSSIVNGILPLSKKGSMHCVVAKLVLAASTCVIWQEQNSRLFKQKKRTKEKVIESILATVRLKLLSFRFKKSSRVEKVMAEWDLPSGSCCCSLGWKSSSFVGGFNSNNGVFVGPTNNRISSTRVNVVRASASSSSSEPLLVRAAKGLLVNRPPAWMMRQAGRYMAIYRKLAEKHPSFREISETTDLIVEISLQPWEAFRPDGVIIFSDILTPLPAFGVPFDIEEVRGPVIQTPIRSEEGLKTLHPINLDQLNFVGESLNILKKEVDGKAAILGFVGAPWTIATYIVEGGTTRTYTNIKSMCHTAPRVLRALLSHLTEAIAEYVVFQVKSGADCVQIFDSWGGQLPPNMWELWSKPYINEIVSIVKKKCPDIPLTLYINGNGGLLEKMKDTGVDVIGLDWTVDMADGRRRLGNDISIQGNVDPAYLFSPLPALEDEIHMVVKCAGPRGHILNLGHGVLVGTPEEAIARFFDVARSFNFDSVEEKSKVFV